MVHDVVSSMRLFPYSAVEARLVLLTRVTPFWHGFRLPADSPCWLTAHPCFVTPTVLVLALHAGINISLLEATLLKYRMLVPTRAMSAGKPQSPKVLHALLFMASLLSFTR